MSDLQPSPDNLSGPIATVKRFRILVIGNANAGKTTILNKVCNGKTDLDAPARERGEHDINKGVVYPTAHGFIFHDSCGFEAGDTKELDRVKEFIRVRSEEEQLENRLHVIWYCLPTSGDRSLTEAEMSLFESGTGTVPVVAIFTKMDAIDKKMFNKLVNDGVAFPDAKKQAPSAAKAKFESDFLKPLQKVRYKPRQTVELRDMHKPDQDCNDLLLSTAMVLDEGALQLLVVSTIRNSLKQRIEVAIKEVIIPHALAALESSSFSQEEQDSLLLGVMGFFPYLLPNFKENINEMMENAVYAANEMFRFDRVEENEFRFDRKAEAESSLVKYLQFVIQSLTRSPLSLPPETQTVILGLSTIIIAEYALSVELSTVIQAFGSAGILDTLVASVDGKFNSAEYIKHEGYLAILEIMEANQLGK